MLTLPIDQCPFTKTNLVTKFSAGKSYDTYQCSRCQLSARRYGLSSVLTVQKAGHICPSDPAAKPAKSVRITDRTLMGQFGLALDSVHTVVPSPEKRFADCIWVYSSTRNEPVRLLGREYELVIDPASV